MTTAMTIPAPSAAPTTERAATTTDTAGVVHGAPRAVLRIEGALTLVGALAAYHALGGSWLWLAVLFLVPDLSMLGYLAGPRIGAVLYNAGHSHVGPALVAGAALALGAPAWTLLGSLIWIGHIGFDRMLGYGLKYGTRFVDTHLGVIGPRRAPAA